MTGAQVGCLLLVLNISIKFVLVGMTGKIVVNGEWYYSTTQIEGVTMVQCILYYLCMCSGQDGPGSSIRLDLTRLKRAKDAG